jgi:hypothetical protein
MTETDLSVASSPSGAFSAAEQRFFQQGEALESGALALEEGLERRSRWRWLWRPRLFLMGAGVCVALLALSLVGGKKPSGDAVAAVRTPPLSLPVEAAPAPAAVDPAPASDVARPVKAKKSERGKRAHRSHARGKRRF